MRAEAWGIARVAEIADDEFFFGEPQVEFCLEVWVVQHALSEAVSDHHDVLLGGGFFEDWGGLEAGG